jgi:hypothetical protein
VSLSPRGKHRGERSLTEVEKRTFERTEFCTLLLLLLLLFLLLGSLLSSSFVSVRKFQSSSNVLYMYIGMTTCNGIKQSDFQTSVHCRTVDREFESHMGLNGWGAPSQTVRSKVLKIFLAQIPLFFNTQTMHIKSTVHNSIAMTCIKNLYPGGIRTRVFCS